MVNGTLMPQDAERAGSFTMGWHGLPAMCGNQIVNSIANRSIGRSLDSQ
jgi:hypothetical protein